MPEKTEEAMKNEQIQRHGHNIGHTRHRTKTNKTKTQHGKKKDEQHGLHQKPAVNSSAGEG